MIDREKIKAIVSNHCSENTLEFDSLITDTIISIQEIIVQAEYIKNHLINHPNSKEIIEQLCISAQIDEIRKSLLNIKQEYYL